MIKYTKKFRVFNSKIKPSLKMNYLVAYPEDMGEGELLPMIVALHGAGERGDNNQAILVHGVPHYLDSLTVRAIILAPQVPDHNHVWNNIADEAFELIQMIAAEFNADRDRISLTGISMGGYGTWEIGMLHPEYFSALAPICGGGMPWRAAVLKNIPIRTYHGSVDGVVPISGTESMVNAVRAAGGNVEFIQLNGVDHGSWFWAYEQTNLIEWLVAQKRK